MSAIAIATLSCLLLGASLISWRALSAERARRHRLARQIQEAVLVLDASGRILEVNARALELYGYAEDELLALTNRQIWAPDELARLPFARDGVSLSYRSAHRRRDGSETPVECSLHRLQQGRALRYEQIVRDLGEQQAAEKRIARLARLHRLRSSVDTAIVRASSAPQLWTTICRRLVEDGGFCQAWIAQSVPETSRLQTLTSFGTGPVERELPTCASAGQALLSDGSLSVRTSGVVTCNDVRTDPKAGPGCRALPSAGVAACALIPVPMRSGNDLALVVQSQEPRVFDAEMLTLLRELAADMGFAHHSLMAQEEAELAQTALSESEALMRLFIEHAPAALAMFDREMRHIAVSRRWLADFGLEGQNIIGLSHYTVFPEIPERWRAVHRAGLAGQVSRSEGDRFERLDGKVQWLRWEVRPWQQADGAIGGIVIFAEDVTARRLAEAAERQAHQRLRRFVDANIVGVLVVRPNGEIVEANDYFLRLIGCSERSDRLSELNWRAITPPEWLDADEQALRELRAEGVCRPYEKEYTRPDGRRVPVLLVDAMLPGPEEEIAAFVLDLGPLKQTEAALREARDIREAILEHMTEGLVIADPRGRIIDINPAAYRLYGFASKSEALSALAHRAALFELASLDGQPVPPDEWPLARACRGEVFLDHQLHVRHRESGRAFIASYGGTPVRDSGGGLRLGIITIRDISAQKEAEQQITQLAFYDPLTRLPNRRLLEERLSQALAHAKRKSAALAVMVMDLDYFKEINDSLGHIVGDALLVEVAQRMLGCVRASDTVARPGGDEFVLVLPEVDAEGAAHLAENLVPRLAMPIQLGDHELTISCSLGISLFPANGSTGRELISRADTAMYRAKQQGRGNYQFFTEDMQREALRLMTMEHQLRKALSTGGVIVYYQPLVRLSDNRPIGLEALVRWQHPARGLLQARELIPVAERSGLIQDLDAFVLRTVTGQIADWSAEGLGVLPVAVNLSARHFAHRQGRHALHAQITTLLSETGISPVLLELEITENSLLEESKDALGALQALRALGVRLALDDFGTGYSNLNYLKAFAVDRLKIDQSFVHALTDQPEQAPIVETILALGRHLRFEVIAEGVETADQLERLLALGCTQAQGYYFSQPLPPHAIEAWLRKAAGTQYH